MSTWKTNQGRKGNRVNAPVIDRSKTNAGCKMLIEYCYDCTTTTSISVSTRRMNKEEEEDRIVLI